MFFRRHAASGLTITLALLATCGASAGTGGRFDIFTGNLSGISSVGDHVWVAGDSGRLYHSTDNGMEWSQIPLPTTLNLADVEFWNDSLGIVTTTDTLFLRTVNGGATWDTMRLGREGGKVQFANNRRVWLFKTFWLWRSDNGGASWTRLTIYEGSPRFLDSLHGCGVRYGENVIVLSPNAGDSWITAGSLPGLGDGGRAIAFRNVSSGIISYNVYNHPTTDWFWGYTANGGATWLELSHAHTAGICSDVDAAGRIYGLEDKGCVYYTGGGFGEVRLDQGPLMRDVSAARGRYPWICGTGGTVLFSPDSGLSWQSVAVNVGVTEEQLLPAVGRPSIAEAIPNPCRDRTVITLPGPSAIASRVRVLDASGRVWRDVDVAAGAVTVVLNTSRLPAGVYHAERDGRVLVRLVRTR